MSAQAPMTETTTQAKPRRPLTLEQEQILREFTEHYGLERKQIGFDGDRAEPIFDVDALSQLALELSDIPSIIIEPGNIDSSVGIVTSSCEVKLADGRMRTVHGSALLGEEMHDGGIINDIKQALDVSAARALRKGFRAVGFDPVKAHEKRIKGQDLSLSLSSEAEQRNRELAEAHKLGEELGYIFGDNKVAWSNLVNSYFPGHTSSGTLNSVQRAQFLSMLRAWKTARSRTSELAASLTHGS